MVSFHAAVVAMLLSSPGQTVMLDFYADWCGPCRAMQTTIRSLEEKGYPVQKVNIDQNPALAAQYGVRSVPCYLMLVDGKEVDRVSGGTTFTRLARMFPTGNQVAGNSTSGNPASGNQAPPSSPSFEPNRLSNEIMAQAQPLDGSFPPQTNSAVIPASYQTPVASNPPYSNQSASPGQQGHALNAKLLAASVRLRIEDANGHSCGSGTIIDSRNGEALVLTCGHIFRDSQGKGGIEVDLFGPYTGQKVAGRLISFDLTRDVGLVAIATPGPIAVAPLPQPGYPLHKGDSVISVGCDNAADPTVRNSYITSLNRYGGPANLQVAGQPTEGRSGGGLFSADGQVIGVCNARDPQDQEGFYAALETITAQLDQDHLSFIYQSPKSNSSQPAPFEPAQTAGIPTENNGTPSMSNPWGMRENPSPMERPQNGPMVTTISQSSEEPLSSGEQAALDEIRRHLKAGAEVVCIVRPRGNTNEKSQVIMLEKASPQFVEQLASEARPATGRLPTSFEVPHPKTPALEWAGNAQNQQGWQAGQ